jgi:hypothetical protein
MDLREKIARAASRAIAQQEGLDGDGLKADLTTEYLDQGMNDFGQVADSLLELPEIKEALAWRAKSSGLAEAMAHNRAAGFNQATDRCDLPPSMTQWQPASTIPTDGTLFNFRSRSFTTAVLMDPLVGRYRGGKLEWNNAGRWEVFGYEPVMWAEIPELI